jgi:hypothetical protein
MSHSASTRAAGAFETSRRRDVVPFSVARAFGTSRRREVVPFRVAARSFETSRRRDVVPFSFHQEVAKLSKTDPDKADHLLERAEAERWTRDRPRARAGGPPAAV